MSRSLNKVTLIGNLGADPEIRTAGNGTKVAQFSLATSYQWKTSAGDKQEKTAWHKCVAWNRGTSGLADIIERYVRKGDKLYVEGRIEYRQYEKDGDTRYVTEIEVQEILLLGNRATPEAAGPAAAPARSTARPTAKASTKDSGDMFSEFPEALEGDDDLPF